jgi:hypothetical protein
MADIRKQPTNGCNRSEAALAQWSGSDGLFVRESFYKIQICHAPLAWL